MKFHFIVEDQWVLPQDQKRRGCEVEARNLKEALKKLAKEEEEFSVEDLEELEKGVWSVPDRYVITNVEFHSI